MPLFSIPDIIEVAEFRHYCHYAAARYATFFTISIPTILPRRTIPSRRPTSATAYRPLRAAFIYFRSMSDVFFLYILMAMSPFDIS